MKVRYATTKESLMLFDRADCKCGGACPADNMSLEQFLEHPLVVFELNDGTEIFISVSSESKATDLFVQIDRKRPDGLFEGVGKDNVHLFANCNNP